MGWTGLSVAEVEEAYDAGPAVFEALTGVMEIRDAYLRSHFKG